MNKYTIESSNAFVNTFKIPPKQAGLLDDLSFAVKDNIDISGYKTSYGSKPWLESHEPAVTHAVCVEQLLNAGATCIGKTISDELTCSLDGESHFYGTPLNPIAPDRVPGGSSSGSASAVACGLVDFSIGTDSAGSTRVPASNCGVLGMRPTMHRISESGVLPFAPSSSTVGVFAKDFSIMNKVMITLLSSYNRPQPTLKKIYFVQDAFSLADDEVNMALESHISILKENSDIIFSSITINDIIGEAIGLEDWRENIFSPIQCAEIYNAVGDWIESYKPEMGARVQDAMTYFKEFNRGSLNKALCLKERMFNQVSNFLNPGELYCFPTVPMIAPLIGALRNMEWCQEYYNKTMSITSFSGVSALPEITIPLARVDGVPLGLSFAASNRQDEFLLSAVNRLFPGL